MSIVDDYAALLLANGAAYTNATLLDEYYDGRQRVQQLGLSLPVEMRELETVVNWPRLVVDSIAERMDIEGFRVSDDEALSEEVYDWWLANDLDALSPLAHVEALVQGVAYIVVNVPKEGIPQFAVETNRTMSVKTDPRSGAITAAALTYPRDEFSRPTGGAYYLPNVTYYIDWKDGAYYVSESRHHNLNEVPVKRIVNRSRIHDKAGRSEISDIIPITDAASRLMTNLQAAQEFLALPQRYVLGATEDDFVDSSGNPVPKWQAYIGNFLALGDPDAKIGQLAGADLRNFAEVFQMYARIVSSLSKLPPHRLGLTGSQAVSADAIRSDESDLIKRIYDRMRTFETPWESAQRLALRWSGRSVTPATRLEAVWASPETPTFAAKADAIVKLTGGPVMARSSGLKELFPPEKAKEYAADLDAQDDPITSLSRAVFQES